MWLCDGWPHPAALASHRTIAPTRSNPWGFGEWRGAWSDIDTTRWTQKARAQCGHARAADDGTFVMSVADFRRHFADLYIVRRFGSGWHRYDYDGEFTARNSGGAISMQRGHYAVLRPTTRLSPQLAFHVLPGRRARVFIAVRQATAGDVVSRSSRLAGRAVGAVLADCGGGRVTRVDVPRILQTGYTEMSVSTAIGEVEGTPLPLTLHVSPLEAGVLGRFSVTVFTTEPLAGTDGPRLRLLPL